MKKALITGIAGQDGSYLTELLLEKGYEVHGLVRPGGTNTTRIDHLLTDPATAGERLFMHEADLRDAESLAAVLDEVAPAEVYNLASQSQPSTSFDTAEYTCDVNATGTVRLLDAIVRSQQQIRFYQASSSEMFGDATLSPQNEQTPFHPRNPYASAKVLAHFVTGNYREQRSLHASCGICYNHESPRRGENFVTRKISRGLARILTRKQELLHLGNLDATRDWGYAKDYVEAMWMMLQAEEGDDYVIATGVSHTIRDFLDEAFGLVGLDWQDHVRVDQKHYRPSESAPLIGNNTKIREKLGWKPRTDFARLVYIMVDADLRLEGMSLADFVTSGRKVA